MAPEIPKDEIAHELTQSQSLLWLGQKLNPDSALYNMAYFFTIGGEINIEVFQRAFQLLITKMDVFRTVFFERDGVPFQKVLPYYDYPFEVIDFTGKVKASYTPETENEKVTTGTGGNQAWEAGLEEALETKTGLGKTMAEKTPIREVGQAEALEDQVQTWLKKRTSRMFDFSLPLFDSALLKVSEGRYIWYLNFHHIITDATSSTLIFKKMSEIYGQILRGDVGEISATPPFTAYTAFEAEQRKSKRDAVHSYWKNKVSEVQERPVFYGRKNVEPSTGTQRISFRLDAATATKIRKLAKRPEVRAFTESLSLFNIFAALLFTYVYRVSGQNRLALGAIAHNRLTRPFKATAGLFIEIFPLVDQLSETDTFKDVLERVRMESNNYIRYAQPGMANAELGRSFNVVLNYINARFSDFDGLPMQAEWIHPDQSDPAHHLRCHVYDIGDSEDIEIHFDLNESIFYDTLSARVPDHFSNLVKALVSDIDRPILDAPLLTASETENLLALPTASPKEFTSIIDQFEKQAMLRPNAVALQFRNKIQTYQELNKTTDRLANILKAKGIGPDNKVVIHLERSHDYVISVLAVLKTGAAFVPVPSDQPDERVAYILKDSYSSLAITSKHLQKNISPGTVDTWVLDDENKDGFADGNALAGGNTTISNKEESIAYTLYTSGSTGKPKGVEISQKALCNYMNWAAETYEVDPSDVFPLFTSIGFDLTLTSTLLPLLKGGRVLVYPEKRKGPDMALMEVLDDNLATIIKLTPSHLALLQGRDFSSSEIKTLIVGGEDFKVGLAQSVSSAFPKDLKIFNEYGPTEATIGCIVSKFDTSEHTGISVPIGKPIANMQAYVLDTNKNPVPQGVIGELYLSGTGLAKGYIGNQGMNSEKFLENPFYKGIKDASKNSDHPDSRTVMYRTGDRARINAKGEFEYLGRIDDQVKLRGYRIEPADIEANLALHPGVENAAVVLTEKERNVTEDQVVNCIQCGLPSNYPNTDFDEDGVCHLCTAFDSYKSKVQNYFKNDDELVRVLTSKRGGNSSYDCISLLSGGKDSTYVLARLVDMGLNVLTFTLDNGYISQQAKDNIDRITARLGVDHMYGETPHMNEIFVDSLHRHHNVCNGCFKTIYTLSTQIALEKNIPFIVTGLSRGQFFETRLTEELFWDDLAVTDTNSNGSDANIAKIDDTILEARKLYHREPDAVKNLLDVSAFESDTVFEKVQFVDFYRYSDVSLEEMLAYLNDKIGWVRPTDTGRSTNCLINQVGIYVHKKEEGYSNYAFPYSWDVRLGHKKREESLEEINEAIDEKEVLRIMDEIGYDPSENKGIQGQKLVAYFTGDSQVSVKALQDFVAKKLPSYMVPVVFKHLETLPMTQNGKVDKKSLLKLNQAQLNLDTPFVAPRNDIEELLEGIWKEVLQLQKVGVHDDFIALGGHSLAAIRVTARINEAIETEFPLNKIFEFPTLAEYARYIEETLTQLMQE